MPLAAAAHAAPPSGQLLTDASYDSGANHRFCRAGLGVESPILANTRRSAAVAATTPDRLELCRVLGEPGDAESRRASRQRWKAETILAGAKRKWEGALTARTDASQAVQALLRGLVDNGHRLVALGAS